MRRTDRLGLRLPKGYKEALRQLAAYEGESMSAVLRRLIREEARKCDLLGSPGIHAGANVTSEGGDYCR